MPLVSVLKQLGRLTFIKVLEPGSSETRFVCDRIQSETALKKVRPMTSPRNVALLFITQKSVLTNAVSPEITRQRSTRSVYSWLQKTTKKAKAIRVDQNGKQTAASSKHWNPLFTRVLWYVALIFTTSHRLSGTMHSSQMSCSADSVLRMWSL